MCCVVGCNKKPERMPIYVIPWYNSDPLTINVGSFSNALRSDNVRKLLATADDIRADIDRTPVEAIFVLAIRLYDVGQKDDAIYWFYMAQFRRNLYARMITKVGSVGDRAFELEQAQSAFKKLSGRWINGYAGGVLDKQLEILDRVRAEGLQAGYIGLAYPELEFKPEIEQAAVVKEIAGYVSELQQYLIDHREELERARKENEIEGKY